MPDCVVYLIINKNIIDIYHCLKIKFPLDLLKYKTTI